MFGRIEYVCRFVLVAWIGSLFVCSCQLASAGVRRHDVADSQYLALASSDPAFDAVGELRWNEAGSGFLGSGTLIDDQWVLTAAHNIDGSNGVGAGITNLRFELGTSTYTAADWIAHPNWFAAGGEGNLFSGWDIGLVRLDSIPAGVAPAELYTGSSELGLTATAVGFGQTGVGTGQPAAQPGSAGTKRAGNNVIDVVGGTQTAGSNPAFAFGHNRTIAVDFDNPGNSLDSTLGSSSPLPLEYLTAPGDSGGALFVDFAGEMQVAGVTSFGSTIDGLIDSDYGDRGSYTRVSQFITWISDTIAANTPSLAGDFDGSNFVDGNDFLLWQRGGSPNPFSPSDLADWESNYGAAGSIAGSIHAIPEPTSFALILMGLCLAARHRR